MKLVCQLDQDGIFLGMTSCQASPLEPGVYLIPGHAIDVEQAPDIPEGKLAKWNGGGWEFIDIQVSEENKPEAEFMPMVEKATRTSKKAKK